MTDQEKIKALEDEVEKWQKKYTCCEGSSDCANNRLKKFCEDILGDKEWSENHEYLYNVIADIEMDRDMNKFHNEDLRKEISSLHSLLDEAERALKKIADHDYIHTKDGCQAELIAKEALQPSPKEEKR